MTPRFRFLKFPPCRILPGPHEAHISAQQYVAQAHSRLSQADVDEKRAKGNQRQARPRSEETVRIALDAPQSFRRNLRLTSKREIDRVFRHANARVTRGPVVVLTVPNDLSYPRLGLAIGKRFIPKAVRRNQTKRLAREWFRLNQESLPNLDMMVILRRRVDDPATIRRRLGEIGAKLKCAR